MKRIILLFTVCIFISISSKGQGENNQWCFGNLAGLNFNSGSPVAMNSQVNTTEGSSSIADASGNLLFYSDGITVWNSAHVAMPNGTGLNGGVSSTQSALIVQQPQTPNIYYVFTTAEAQGAQGFCYSIVDMTLQGGLGDVTTKNALLYTPTAEKVCATKHSNGTDIWILSHELGTNNFVAYLLTSGGLSAPVISACGTVHTILSGVEIGYMKFSCDGKQVASAMRYLFSFELDSFNTTTGIVSAPISFSSTNGIQSYGIEFSPDGHFLYTSDSQVSQYDVTVHDSAAILASKTFISADVWALQMGPDSKIYIAGYFQPSLSVINDPNVAGLGCNYVSAAIPLSGTSSLGLPNVLNNLCSGPPVAIFSADNHICPGTCTDFSNLSINANSFLWTFTGASPNTSTDVDPTQICYNSPGQYDVMLIATGANGTDTLLLHNFITVYPYPAPQGIAQSGDTLIANQGAVSYQWYHSGILIPGATDYFYVQSEGGDFNVVCTDANGCEVEAVIFDVPMGVRSAAGSTIQLEVYPNPVNDKLEIRNFGKEKAIDIFIYNVLGEKVYSNINCVMRSVDCSRFSSGLYWLEVCDGTRTLRTKFVKQ